MVLVYSKTLINGNEKLGFVPTDLMFGEPLVYEVYMCAPTVSPWTTQDDIVSKYSKH